MLQHSITRSITYLVAIALLAWSAPVVAYDIDDDGFRLTSQERGNTSVAAKDAEKGTSQPHLPFELSPYDRWNTSVVAFDSEGSYGMLPEEALSVVAVDVKSSTYRLSPEEILSMVTFDAEDSAYGDGLLREDLLAVARAQILADNVNRIVSGVFYNAEGRHL